MSQEYINSKLPKKPKYVNQAIVSVMLSVIALNAYLDEHTHNLTTLESNIKISQSEEKDLINKTMKYEHVANKVDMLATPNQMLLDSMLIEKSVSKRVQTNIRLHQKNPKIIISDGTPAKYNDEILQNELFNKFYTDFEVVNTITNNNIMLMTHYLLLWNQNLLKKENILALTPEANQAVDEKNNKTLLIDSLGSKFEVNPKPNELNFSFNYDENAMCSSLFRMTEYEYLNEQSKSHWHVDKMTIIDPNHHETNVLASELNEDNLDKLIPKINQACNLDNNYGEVKNFSTPGQVVIHFKKS